ncbi:hypothetical protein J6590_049622 [Homalodisca vitripennis]|nr:hypothetical protein J6590_049622 [Homalodisca vitripennis]
MQHSHQCIVLRGIAIGWLDLYFISGPLSPLSFTLSLRSPDLSLQPPVRSDRYILQRVVPPRDIFAFKQCCIRIETGRFKIRGDEDVPWAIFCHSGQQTAREPHTTPNPQIATPGLVWSVVDAAGRRRGGAIYDPIRRSTGAHWVQKMATSIKFGTFDEMATSFAATPYRRIYRSLGTVG